MKPETLGKIWMLVLVVTSMVAAIVLWKVWGVPQFVWAFIAFLGSFGLVISNGYQKKKVSKKTQIFYKYFYIVTCIGFFFLTVYKFLIWIGYISDF